MSCEEVRELLTFYVDGELDVRQDLQIERHVQDCPTCRERLDKLQSLHTAFGDSPLYHRAPLELRERMLASMLPRRRKPFGPSSRLALASAASVVLAVGIGTWALVRSVNARSEQQQVVEAVTSSYVRSLMPGHGPDFVSTDRHKVKPWFAGKLHFSPPVKDLAAKGFPLTGGSVDYVDGHEAAVLVYNRRDHVINLLIWPEGAADETTVQSVSRAGYHLLHWAGGGFSYWVVSDVNESELRDFAQLFRE